MILERVPFFTKLVISEGVPKITSEGVPKITSIGSVEGGPIITATVTNGIQTEGVYTITSGTAKLHLTSETATELVISTEQVVPEEWLAFSENVERYFDASGNYTLYIYGKDANGVANTTPYTLNIKVDMDSTRPTFPGETINEGDIQFEIVPVNGNGVWAKAKNVLITYTEGMQSNGYTSSYATKTTTQGEYSSYKIVYDKQVSVPITKNGTKVNAKITYGSDYTSKEIANAEIEVDKIDNTAPRITSFEKLGTNKVKGVATDSESGLASAPYLITMNYIDFSVKDINTYTWESTGTATLTESGRYYFYAKDDVGNVAVKSINVDAPDGSSPIIDSVKATPERDYVIIKLIAHDNLGIVGYAMIKDEATIPSSSAWTNITATQQIAIEQNVTEDGKYYVWVIDDAGNRTVESVLVTTYKSPILNENYPAEKTRVNEGEQATFQVVIGTEGYPNEYEYAWQISKDNGTTWETIPGARSATYTTPATKVTEDGYIYKCIVTNARGPVESRIAKLEVVGITENKPRATATLEKEMVLAGITINNGASTTVSSTLEIQVFAINAAQVCISDTGSKNNNWVPYANTITYTLSSNNRGNGLKTISVWIRDDKGNELNKMVTAQITKTD